MERRSWANWGNKGGNTWVVRASSAHRECHNNRSQRRKGHRNGGGQSEGVDRPFFLSEMPSTRFGQQDSKKGQKDSKERQKTLMAQLISDNRTRKLHFWRFSSPSFRNEHGDMTTPENDFIAAWSEAYKAANPERPVPSIVSAGHGWYRFSDSPERKRRSQIEQMTERLRERVEASDDNVKP